MAYIDAICISKKKGIVKKPIEAAEFVENFGIKGDAHAGDWHRQVSILARESIERVKEKLPDLTDGAFAENIICVGLNLKNIKVGNKLKTESGIILEITQIGKECHTQCIIGKTTGDCIMPTEGLFAKVLRGGIAKSGNKIEIISD